MNKNNMKPWLNDVAVLSIFFARPEIFAKSFERIREARPRVLLLWQDGPREGRPDDLVKIEECRKIASNIDWECEVHTNYHDENMGCDPSTHLSHKWAFSIVDKCIILEDDIIPSLSFFPFCKELLDKYEYDERIDRICGRNLLDEYKSDLSDYFFAKSGNSHGWASWRRVADKWESEYQFLNDAEALRLLRIAKYDKKNHDKWLKRCYERAKTGKSYWEYIVGTETYLNGRVVIYPTVNLISNIGIGENSTHFATDERLLTARDKKRLIADTVEIKFPLREPKYVVADDEYIQSAHKKYHSSKVVRVIKYLRRRLRAIYFNIKDKIRQK